MLTPVAVAAAVLLAGCSSAGPVGPVTVTVQSSPAVSAPDASSSAAAAPDCGVVAAAGQADLDGKAAWLAANDARDAAMTAYMGGADYVGVTDAQAAADAKYAVWQKASFAYLAVKRTPGCEAVSAAHDQVDLARDLVLHKSAGADAKLAAALVEWHKLAG